MRVQDNECEWMRVLKFCLTSPLSGEKGDGKLVMGRIKGLGSCGVCVDVAYFRFSLRDKTRVRLFRDRRVSGIVIELQMPIRKVLCGVWKNRKFLKKTPIQTWLSYGYAGSGCNEIPRLLSSYEIVHFYHIRSAGLMRLANRSRFVILDLIDSYALNLRSRNEEKRLGFLMKDEYTRIQRAEQNIDMFAPATNGRIAYLTVSERDNAEIKTVEGAKFVVPVGTDIDTDVQMDIGLDRGREDLTAVFFGNLNYGPNINAAKRLAAYKRDLDSMGNRPYKISFTVAGRHVSNRLKYQLRSNGIRVVSPVNDMKDLVCAHDIVILPMQSGSGMQSKLLEAIAWKRLVFASRLVAEPLGLVEGQEYICIESSTDLDVQLKAMVSGEVRASEMTRKSSERLEKYSWQRTGKQLKEIYTKGSGDGWENEMQ